jgi:hypothetical protein
MGAMWRKSLTTQLHLFVVELLQHGAVFEFRNFDRLPVWIRHYSPVMGTGIERPYPKLYLLKWNFSVARLGWEKKGSWLSQVPQTLAVL